MKKLWGAVTLTIALAPLVSAQAIVDGFTLDQLTFADPAATTVACSEYGQAGFAVRQLPGQIQYVQIAAQLSGSSVAPAWIVQNVPIVPSVTSQSTNVDLTKLGIQRGTCITGMKVAYAITVTDAKAAIGNFPSLPTTAIVGQLIDDAGGVTIPDVAFVSMNLPHILAQRSNPPAAAGDLNVMMIDRSDMGNVLTGKRECGPAAVTNSLHWLQSNGNIGLNSDTPDMSLQKLKSDMSFDVTKGGASPSNIIAGKLIFAQRPEHPLKLDIHYQAQNMHTGIGASVKGGNATANRDGGDAAPTADYIKQEVAKGQDVELSLLWVKDDGTPYDAHVVAISGLLTGPDGTAVFTNDARKQDGTAAGLRNNHFSPLGTNNGHVSLMGLKPNQVVAVYSESPIPTYTAYVPQENSNTLAVYNVLPQTTTGGNAREVVHDAARDTPAAAGGLTQVPGSPFSAGAQAVATAVALGRFVYTANYGSGNISGFKIDATSGALTPITGSPFAAGTNPFSIAIDPVGKFAYVANSNSSNISAFLIDPITGALSAVVGSPFATSGFPNAVAVSPSGRLLYSANGGTSGIAVYSIDGTTGALTAVPGSPFFSGDTPYSVAPDPSGRFVYAVNQGAGNVSAFSVGITGALTKVAGSPFTAGAGPNWVAIDPAGHYAYVSNFSSSNVSAFAIDQTTGALTQISGSPYSVPAGPFGVATEQTGNYVYVSSQTNSPGSISAFTIGAGGTLTPVSGSPFPGGGGPARLAIVPIGPSNGIANPTPTVTQLAPSAVKSGTGPVVVSVYGTNFVPGAVVRWNNVARTTAFINRTQLNAAITAADVANLGSGQIAVSNPTPGGGNSAAATFTVSASPVLPTVPGTGTVNAASFLPGVAVVPGSIASVFGSSLATSQAGNNGLPLPTQLGNLSVSLSSKLTPPIAAPLFFAASGQVNIQIPWELAGQQRATATFTNGASTGVPATGVPATGVPATGVPATGVPATMTLAQFAPGVFTVNSAGQGAIQISATGEFVAPAGSIPGAAARPAAKGEFITIYCTGLGDVTNRPATGVGAPSSPTAMTTTTPVVTIGGAPATVSFSGLAPGFVGLYQVNVPVPSAATSGSAVTLQLSIGGIAANSVTIAVQ